MKLFQIILIYTITIFISIKADKITTKLINNNITEWFASFIIPTIIVVILAFSVSRLIYTCNLCKKKIRLITSFVVFSSLIINHLIQNPPYLEDYSTYGTSIDIKNNNLIKDICCSTPSFDGILMIGSVSCPHCMSSAEKLSILQKRAPNRDIRVVLFTDSEDQLRNFIQNSGVKDLHYSITKNEKDVLSLCDGRFPTFIYIKEDKAVHKWRNSEFGFRAYDIVESGLK